MRDVINTKLCISESSITLPSVDSQQVINNLKKNPQGYMHVINKTVQNRNETNSSKLKHSLMMPDIYKRPD